MNSPQNSPVWFITGCSTGIGRVLATQALAAGHRVVATARQPAALQALVQQYPDHCLALALDVNQQDQIQAAAAQALAHFGRIDILMNNAGYGLEGVTEEVTMEQVRHQMETNVFGLVAMTQAVLPTMRQQGRGWVINVASIAGLRGFRGMPMYCMSKFAVVGFSECLAQELKPFGIAVSCVEPGPYRTEWAGRSLIKSGTIANQQQSPYHEVNAGVDGILSSVNGKQPGDPSQIAAVLIDGWGKLEQAPVHMLFGDEAITGWQRELENFANPAYMRHYPHTKRTL